MNLTSDQIKQLEDIIINGTKKGYWENIFLTESDTTIQSRIIEYLISVNIAQSILTWKHKREFKIFLEYSLSDFYNGAFPNAKKIHGNTHKSEVIKRKNHNTNHNKARIDIAITKDPHGLWYTKPKQMSVAGIEIKSINKSIFLIKSDINRLTIALKNKDKVGQNNIDVCFCMFIKRLDKPNIIITKKDIKIKINENFNEWKKLIKAYNVKHQNIKYSLKKVIIEKSPREDLIKIYSPKHFDYSEVAEKSGLVVCYLITIKRK